MLDDFNSRWWDACYYMPIITCGERNRQVGIPTHLWAMRLDPCTKKYIARVLPHEIDTERLWKDVESACVEKSRINFQNTEREPQQQEPDQSESHMKRKKNGAASYFPESDEEMENENHRLPVETIVADEIRKYQLDNGLKLETDGSYNCPLKWGSLNHSNYPSVWKLGERILPMKAT